MESASTARTLLAVFAHPDDESFGPGGTLARYVREGVQVHLDTRSLDKRYRIYELTL